MIETPLSHELMQRARRVIPGGVNSPVRAFQAVTGDPLFIARGEGNWLVDVDGHRYLDLIGSWGPLLFGHADPGILEAIRDAMSRGTSFGAPTPGEVEFAEELVVAHPALEMVRLCSSGTEATMHAVRLARGHTGRDRIIKIDGCFHGSHDAMLVAAGSGVATFARPGSPGIPADVAALTLTAPFNDLGAIERHLQRGDVACVITEPVPGNMGCIPPEQGYLHGLQALCLKHGALLIIDEVMTGFRLARGGACERYGLQPDLVTLGKIVGGGLPLAAFGGRREIMEKLSPSGPVYQAGTLSGNPLAVAAGRASLARCLPEVYVRLEQLGEELEAALLPAVTAQGLSFARVGSMFTIFYRATPPRNFDEVRQCDFPAFGRFHRRCLHRGIYLPPAQYEAAFLPASLQDQELGHLIAGLRAALAEG
jgi:glutamate-1-semialdehyde 2,1-aminomutase